MCTVLDVQRNLFLKRRKDAMEWKGPVPLKIEHIIAHIIVKGRKHQSSVKLVVANEHMEATVTSRLEPTNKWRVVIQ